MENSYDSYCIINTKTNKMQSIVPLDFNDLKSKVKAIDAINPNEIIFGPVDFIQMLSESLINNNGDLRLSRITVTITPSDIDPALDNVIKSLKYH